MNVREVMTKDVKTCGVDDTLSAAARIMWDCDCGCVPVVNSKDEAIGMITDRDICMAAYLQNRPIDQIFVSSAMSPAVHGCGPDDTLEVAEQIMREHQVRRLPVLTFDNQVLGILSLTDIACVVAEGKRPHGPGMSPAAIEATLAAVCRPRRTTAIPLGDGSSHF
jgi:CBS domain-containing protein